MKIFLSIITMLLTFTTTVCAKDNNVTIREIVFDTETTGLSIDKGDRIIEIGAVELINKVRTGKTFHKYINPEIDFPKGDVHNITSQSLEDKPKFDEIAQEWIDFVGDSNLIAHNALGFDMKFINHELKKAGHKEYKKERFVDTLLIAKNIFPTPKDAYVTTPNNLDALCERFNIDNSERKKHGHGALRDAELLADIYIMMSEYADKTNFDAVKNTIDEAIKNNKKIKITYYSNPFFKNQITTRTVIPHKLGLGSELKDKKLSKFKLKDNEFYLHAFCELDKDNRTFVVSRILKIDIVE